MFRSIRAGLVGALLLMGPAVAAPKGPPGATAAELIALARQLSPELAAAALTADAAIARITSAGALPDPTLRVGADNLDQRNISMNGTTTTYRLMQEFPLWGKLDLKQEMATFEATAARYRRQGAELELVARVKSVFANALLNRRPNAPLAIPVALRPLPNERKLNVAVLVDRAIRLNPTIAEGQAKAGSATAPA